MTQGGAYKNTKQQKVMHLSSSYNPNAGPETQESFQVIADPGKGKDLTQELRPIFQLPIPTSVNVTGR